MKKECLYCRVEIDCKHPSKNYCNNNCKQLAYLKRKNKDTPVLLFQSEKFNTHPISKTKNEQNVDVEDEERYDNRRVSLEEGRELLKHTSMPNLTDEELKDLLDNIKLFCELCYDIYKEEEYNRKLGTENT